MGKIQWLDRNFEGENGRLPALQANPSIPTSSTQIFPTNQYHPVFAFLGNKIRSLFETPHHGILYHGINCLIVCPPYLIRVDHIGNSALVRFFNTFHSRAAFIDQLVNIAEIRDVIVPYRRQSPSQIKRFDINLKRPESDASGKREQSQHNQGWSPDVYGHPDIWYANNCLSSGACPTFALNGKITEKNGSSSLASRALKIVILLHLQLTRPTPTDLILHKKHILMKKFLIDTVT